MTEQLTQTELMLIDYEFNRTMRELSKIIPSIDSLDYRRLTYLIIETRRAAYRAILNVDFSIQTFQLLLNPYSKRHAGMLQPAF